jgi:hypothetical protein
MKNLAFEIGYDHYRFGLPLEIVRFSDTHRQEIRYGFDAAKIGNVSQKKPDLFERKLMTLRDRALIKGLEVTVTTNDLRIKLEQTKGYCPITENAFSFADNNSTDWSIDRVDNLRGYSTDNIEIVSVIANQAKSDLDLVGIIKFSIGKARSDSLLTQVEWFRMAHFYYKRMKILKPLNICRILTESQSLYDQLVFMQLFKNDKRQAKAFLHKLEKYCAKDVIVKASKLTHKRVYNRRGIDVEVLYDSPKLYQWVQCFIRSINAHSTEFDLLLMDCMFG